MLCDKCGNSKFTTIKVRRDFRFINGRWVYNKHYDTRVVLCDNCSTKYHSESRLTHKYVFVQDTLKSKIVEVEKSHNE